MTTQVVAAFSACRRYRYTLWREWIGGEGVAMVIGLNPSTADEVQDDPTVRRCITFAKSWGYAALCMTNLFGFRATDPADMLAVDDPVGADNDRHLLDCSRQAQVVVAAWGEHGVHLGRAQRVAVMLGPLHVLRLNKSGQPAHPLYLPRGLRPVSWLRN
jgi:hypothetical protein